MTKAKKKKKPVSRNVLIRKIDKAIAFKLDQFKEANGINVDTKAILYMIDKWDDQMVHIREINDALQKTRDSERNLKSLLLDMKIAKEAFEKYCSNMDDHDRESDDDDDDDMETWDDDDDD